MKPVVVRGAAVLDQLGGLGGGDDLAHVCSLSLFRSSSMLLLYHAFPLGQDSNRPFSPFFRGRRKEFLALSPTSRYTERQELSPRGRRQGRYHDAPPSQCTSSPPCTAPFPPSSAFLGRAAWCLNYNLRSSLSQNTETPMPCGGSRAFLTSGWSGHFPRPFGRLGPRRSARPAWGATLGWASSPPDLPSGPTPLGFLRSS